jgi:hypothetical protein
MRPMRKSTRERVITVMGAIVSVLGLKIAFAPLPLGGAGGGAQLRQREKPLLVCAGFQPARDLFWVSTLVAALLA